jgi:transposase-like protein
MKAMARQRSHSIAFKRQVAQEFIAGETLYGLSKRHDISRQLIRVWVQKYEAVGLDEDAQAADLVQEYEAKIAAIRIPITVVVLAWIGQWSVRKTRL